MFLIIVFVISDFSKFLIMTLYRTLGLIIWSSVELYFITVFYEREVSIFRPRHLCFKFYERVISIDNSIGGMLNVRVVSIF